MLVTFETTLVIPDFTTAGEERATDPPIDTHWDRHLTGGRLTPGMRVLVQDVWKMPGASNLQCVWARVGPDER